MEPRENQLPGKQESGRPDGCDTDGRPLDCG
jgi:hypothetical protein